MNATLLRAEVDRYLPGQTELFAGEGPSDHLYHEDENELDRDDEDLLDPDPADDEDDDDDSEDDTPWDSPDDDDDSGEDADDE